MDNQQKPFTIDNYIEIAVRRKWLIIIPFILSLIITPCLYWKLPKIYRSDASILVLPQKVPEEYVKATVTTSIQARLAIITEEVLSRTRLENIIEEFNLYLEERKKQPIDLIVEKARKNIGIDVKAERSYRRGDVESGSFKIYYQNKNPETARRVTNKLASLFIEENLKDREQHARATSEFMNKELESTKKKLEELELAITEFKYQHMGNLPEQNAANIEIMRQLAEQNRTINERIARAEDKALLIQQQLSVIDQFQDDEDKTSFKILLEAAKKELLALKGTYTDNHIEVRKVQARIKQLEDRLASGEKDTQAEALEEFETKNPVVLDLKNQLISTNQEIERLKKDEARITQQIAVYEKRIEEVPRVELQLAALTRDNMRTRQFYDELLIEKMKAEQAENLERRQQGEQFRILDPASLPRIPYKPDPKNRSPFGISRWIRVGISCRNA